jgi:hypothetical protein
MGGQRLRSITSGQDRVLLFGVLLPRCRGDLFFSFSQHAGNRPRNVHWRRFLIVRFENALQAALNSFFFPYYREVLVRESIAQSGPHAPHQVGRMAKIEGRQIFT